MKPGGSVIETNPVLKKWIDDPERRLEEIIVISTKATIGNSGWLSLRKLTTPLKLSDVTPVDLICWPRSLVTWTLPRTCLGRSTKVAC